jgi:hypothetical protein
MSTFGTLVTRCGVLTLVLANLAACGAGEEASEAEPLTSAREAASDPMMDEMTAHVGRMSTMPADSLQATLPTHRQMVGNVLARMNADMRSMNMGADADWVALVDSIRSDVVALPDLGAPELAATMPEHLGRVSRLLDSHRAMMRAMGM